MTHPRMSRLHGIFARDAIKNAALIGALTPADFAGVHLVPLVDLEVKLQAVVRELTAAGIIKEE